MNGRKTKKKVVLINVLLLILAPVIIVLGYQVYRIYDEYHKGTEEYENLRDIGLTENDKDTEEKGFEVDFQKLAEINQDIVAWIRFEEPSVISYPVVQNQNPEKYLTTTFEGQENGAGCIYMDSKNACDFSDFNTFIYGHHRKNGHMFGSLNKYKDEEFYKNHPFFEIYTPEGVKHTYQIFAVTVVDASSDSYRKVYVNQEEYKNYIDMVQELSLYETGIEVTEDALIVSLSTCTNIRMEERLLIHGVKMNEEKIK